MSPRWRPDRRRWRPPGWRIAIDRKGRFVGLEVKRPIVGKVTALQEKTLQSINLGGGYAVVVRSVEDVQAAMESSEQKKSAFFIDPQAR